MRLRSLLSRIPFVLWFGVLSGIIQSLLLLTGYAHIESSFNGNLTFSKSFIVYFLLYFIFAAITGVRTLHYKESMNGALAGLAVSSICTVVIMFLTFVVFWYEVAHTPPPHSKFSIPYSFIIFYVEVILLVLNATGVLIAIAGGVIGRQPGKRWLAVAPSYIVDMFRRPEQPR